MPLGLPWNLLTGGAPDAWLPWLGILAPAVNLAALVAVCRVVRRRKR